MRSLAEATIHRHVVLNPRLWNGTELKPDVKEALIRFGRAWAKFAMIPEHAVLDIRFVGGNASYYYGDDSDVDVHVVIDKKQLGYEKIMDQFLEDRKDLWTLKHHVTVRGYALEPYAQGVDDFVPEDEAVYSLFDGTWLQQPMLLKYDPDKDPALSRKVEQWKRVLAKASEGTDAEAMRGLKERVKSMRAAGLHSGGEMSQKNLIFKELRNLGYLDMLKKHLRKVEDAKLSEETHE